MTKENHMKRLLVLFMPILLFASTVQGQATNNSPFAMYSVMKKELSVLEWRLVQVNLKLGETGYFVYFDNKLNLFKVDKFIDTYTLDTTAPTLLRELLLSKCNLVKAVIGSEFPEFRERDSKDMNIKFIIGEPSARHFASYSSGSLSFTDEYYSFRKEQGK
jgi:hypothetical protein